MYLLDLNFLEKLQTIGLGINNLFLSNINSFNFINSVEENFALENTFRNFSFIFLFVAMVYYWSQTAFYFSPKQSKNKSESNIGNFLIFLANLSLVTVLVLRWKNSGHFPLSNLYESLMFLSWSCTTLHFFLLTNQIQYNTPSNPPERGVERPSGSWMAGGGHGTPQTSINLQGTMPPLPPPSGGAKDPTGLGWPGVRLPPPANEGVAAQVASPLPLEPPDIKPFSLPSVNEKLYFNKDLQQKIIGSFTAPCALLMNAYATFSLPKDMQQVAPLVPALQSNWLMMHVTVMILSYAALILGSLLSVAFLIVTSESIKNLSSIIRTKFLNRKFNSTTLDSPQSLPDLGLSFIITPNNKKREIADSLVLDSKNSVGALAQSFPSYKEQNDVDSANQDFAKTKKEEYSMPKGYNKLKTPVLLLENIIENLENYSYRLIGIGFSFLTIGILSGAVWANEAWGSYWSWDPKETWAFLTWLTYATYLHTRLTKGWQGKKPAILASIGFITVWICFLGVNLIGEGLHSYGWFVKK